MVRGLALRSLCGLGLESVLEYIENPLKKSFTDVSPYVRRTGVMGVLKVAFLSCLIHCMIRFMHLVLNLLNMEDILIHFKE